MERGIGDVVAAHLEEIAQPLAGIAAAEAVGAQDLEIGGDLPAELLAERLDIVGGEHHRPRTTLQLTGEIGAPGFLPGMQPVPTLGGPPIARQLADKNPERVAQIVRGWMQTDE